jgi:hypothetical protein
MLVLMKSKALKPTKAAHTPKTHMGKGDYYGTGVRQNMGKVIEGMGVKTLSKKQLKTPPKSVA